MFLVGLINSFTVSAAFFPAVLDATIKDVYMYAFTDNCTGEVIAWVDPPPYVETIEHSSAFGVSNLVIRPHDTAGSSIIIAQFNLSSIPTNAQIISARLVTSNVSLNASLRVGIQRISSPWTYTFGVHHSPCITVPTLTPFPGITINNLTPLVQAWVNGTVPNFGLAVIPIVPGVSYFGVTNRETPPPAQLIIDYRIP